MIESIEDSSAKGRVAEDLDKTSLEREFHRDVKMIQGDERLTLTPVDVILRRDGWRVGRVEGEGKVGDLRIRQRLGDESATDGSQKLQRRFDT